MNRHQKHFPLRLLAVATLLAMVPLQGAWAKPAPPALGRALPFAVLGGTNVTCTNGSITGDVGVSPGGAVPFTDTGCPITGNKPPATNTAAAGGRSDFLRTFDALRLRSTSCTHVPGNLAGENLSPGVYCVDTVAKAGVLTLSGPSTGVWIFLGDGALTGTGFTVNILGGGKACNVWWAPNTGVTMNTSTFQGNILAGSVGYGSITFTGGTLYGRALADIAVTTTGTVITRAAGTGCSK
jgi:hypothetical protein